VLTEGFDSAADPEVSFDGSRILFAGKRSDSELWQIFEMAADGSGTRQITREARDCRSPIYQSQLFTLDAEKPWQQIAFVQAGSLYSARLDGTGIRRLTWSGGSDFDPVMAPDGRMLFTQQQGARSALFGVNLDGTDYALFSGFAGGRLKRMPAVTANRVVMFVESMPGTWDGAGALATVGLRRPMHSYNRLPQPGLFHSPAALPDGSVLVSARPATGGTHAIHRFDPTSGSLQPIYDDEDRHDMQAKLLAPRPIPDGRSSVVDENAATAKLYCLSVNTTDGPAGRATRLRISNVDRRVLAEVELEDDGSFHLEVPALTPLVLQTLDAKGLVLRTSAPVWAMNRENRGCIGCHEDPELVPENRLARALTRPAIRIEKGLRP
jgi:hypothetical protein